MAVHMAAADDVFGGASNYVVFSTGCLRWDLGLNCVSSLESIMHLLQNSPDNIM